MTRKQIDEIMETDCSLWGAGRPMNGNHAAPRGTTMITLRLKRRELATLMAALNYWELQGIMSDNDYSHKISKRAGSALSQGEREALADRLEHAERGESS
jgi:hypothetical protein